MIRIKLPHAVSGDVYLVNAESSVSPSTRTAKPAHSGLASACDEALFGKRLTRERKTIEAMIRCYCREQHAQQGLCPECQGLLDYATMRLARCRFGELKPTCANCPVHCYAPARREQVKQVMRYAGPRMLWLHPVLAVRHILDGYRKAPAVKTGAVPAP